MTLQEREKEHIVYVLAKTHWDLKKTSRILQIPLSQLTQKIQTYELIPLEMEESSQ